MGGWRPGRAISTVAASILVLSSCSVNRNAPVAKEMDEASGRPGATSTISEGFQKETIPAEAAAAPSRGGAMLEPGEAIWVRSGKSRVLQLKNPIKRVSLGDPSLAGIVVLGPRTIMVNAKEVPPIPGGGGGGGAGATVGAVTGKTLTPEPHMAETTLILWDGSQTPDIHSLFIADFVDQQILLEVSVADLDRTALEEHGIDFRNAANAFVSAYFMGGGGLPLGSFVTRRVSTATRLRNGQTLVIGGLLQRTRDELASGVPYLQDIPAVGYLFRHTTYTDEVKELLVVVTPHLVAPMKPGTEVALPTDRAPLSNEDIRTKADPAEVTRPRIPGLP